MICYIRKQYFIIGLQSTQNHAPVIYNHSFAAMANTYPEFDDIMSCSICCEHFNHTDKVPKALPCMHNFCLECLATYVMNKAGLQLACPMCKTMFTVPLGGVQAISTNIAVKQLLDHIDESPSDQPPSEYPSHVSFPFFNSLRQILVFLKGNKYVFYV